MMFGEIVEPSTRALILDDDLLELPQYTAPLFQWQGDPNPPENVEALILADSSKVVQVCLQIIKNLQPRAKLANQALAIFHSKENYLVIYDGKSTELVNGELVELLTPWLKKAKVIHCITSMLLSTFQPLEVLPNPSPVTFTRCLTNETDVPHNFCKRLEPPNLVQGFGANVFSYCIHNKLKCSLWVIFTDNMPLDSLNSTEIIKLLKILGNYDISKLDFSTTVLTSNLYM